MCEVKTGGARLVMGTADNKKEAINGEEKVELTYADGDNGCKHPPVKIPLRTKLKDRDFRRKCLCTLWFGASFFVLGLTFSQRGPAFLDLQIITQTDVEAASYFFTASSVGYLVGSLVAGMVYEKLNKSLLMLLCLLCMAVATIAVPWCSLYSLMVAIHFVFSFFGGGLETVGNAEMLRLWGKKGEVAMQFVHFAYALGGVFAPLVTEPFLTPIREEEDTLTTATAPSNDSVTKLPGSAHFDVSLPTSFNASAVSYLFTDIGTTTLSALNSSASLWNVTTNVTESSAAHARPVTTRVHYAYIISGCITLCVMIPVTVQLFTDRSQKRRQTAEDEKRKSNKQPLPLCLFLLVLSSLCLFNFMNVSVEDTFASYLSAFVVKQLHWSKSSGAQATSLFWAFFASCRFVFIFIVHFLSSVKVLLWCCFSLKVSLLLFMLSSWYSFGVGVWVSSALVGVSLAPIFPMCFSWMEGELVRVTGRVAACIVIAASAGSSSSPILLGYLMQQRTPMWYAYLMFVEAGLCMLVFLFLLALSRLYLRKRYAMAARRQHQEAIVAPPQQDGKAAGGESTC
ncbi:hypothetical protein ACOMHN_048874 [Nucella lapillus]